MFETMQYLTLQQYWWFLVSLLGALLVFLLFVQGGQTLLGQIGKTDKERTMMINVLGRKWELTFTTLVTFGGAAFASFPLFYSVSFHGAYWVWMFILFAFIIQAVAYEYRNKAGNFLGQKTYDAFLFVNGLLATILLGAAVSTFFTGGNFTVDSITKFSHWDTPYGGLEAIWTTEHLAFLQNLALGLAIFFLSRVLGLLYFIRNIAHDAIVERSRKQLKMCAIAFLVTFLFWIIRLMFIDGFAVNPETHEIFMEPYKYLHNLLAMPMVLILLLVGVVGVLWGLYKGIFDTKTTMGFWYTGIGVVLVVLAIFSLAGYNNTSFYPSLSNLQSSLTIENASSSHYTLIAMSYVSLMIPFVLWYIIFVWRKLNAKPIDEAEIETEEHLY